MKTLKKILCTLLVVVMCMTSAPLQGFVGMEWPDLPEISFSEWFGSKASAATEGYYTYTVANGKASITDVSSSISGDVTIPSTLGGYDVTTIDAAAFYNCYSLTSVTIPDSVITIGGSAFSGCDSLTNITIPDSVTSIGDFAFLECKSLTSITIPDSVITIGGSAFSGCDSLTNITIPDSVTSIGDSAFFWCDSLTNMTIPESVTTIGNSAFSGCDSLTSITIPDSVTTIGDSAFSYCSNLTSVTIPNSVITIGDEVFYSCSNLKRIVVDDGNQFYCSDSFGVLYNKNKTTLIQYPSCNERSEFTIPDSVITIGDSAFFWCDSLTNITIPDSVTTIGNSAFLRCDSLTSITIPNSVTAIGDFAFSSCLGIKSVTIPDSVITIGYSAFSSCYSLTNVTIGNSVAMIGVSAFSTCKSLTSVTIGNSVTTIGDGAFYGCNSLIDVYYYGTEAQWKAINVGSGNDSIMANIHYLEGDNPTNPNNPDNPDKPKEEPRDFSDYEVESGKLEEVIYGVDSNGNECITEVVVNGKKYNIKRDTETFIGLSDNSIQNELNKNVAFAVLDGEIVMLIPIGYLLEDDITSHIQDDIGLYCGHGEMYSEEDYNRGFKWSEPDKNNIVYPIYEAFNPNKEFQLKTYLIQKDFFVAASHPEFDNELMEYVTSQIPESQIHIDKIQIKLRNTNAISFNGKDTYTINVNADIKSNQTLDHFIPIVVKDKYEIPEDKSVELVLFDIVIAGERNGEKVEFTNTENIKIRNRDYVEPVKDKNNSKPTKRQYAKDAAAKLDGLTGAITLTGLLELFSSEELDYIGNIILAEIAMAEAPKDTLKQYLSTKVIDSLFNIDSNFIKVGEDTIEFAVAGDTKYGEIKLKLICKYSKVNFRGSEFCFTGSVDYEVVGGKGASKLPSSYKNGGLAGMFSSVDMQSFCESAYKLFECHLQKGVDEIWGNDVDGAADLIFGTIVNEILAETELESVSNIAFELIAKPGKSVLINCPVDVYVYNADNELVAAVVGNEVIKIDEKAKIAVDGDVKKVILLDDSYNIVYKAMADGEMKVTVEEYGTSGGLLNSSTISKIPLIAGRKYTQSIDNGFMEDSDYMIVSASGNKYVPDKEYSTLAGHDYVSGIIKKVTCQENGYMIHTCSKCGYVFAETIQSNGHNFTEGESKCSNCDFDRANNCGCKCHKTGFFAKIIWKITIFFNKIFKKNKECTCGIYHY